VKKNIAEEVAEKPGSSSELCLLFPLLSSTRELRKTLPSLRERLVPSSTLL
jgi:hypothetical protein